jgi:hypothetical protein
MDISEQAATFQLVMGMTKWGSLAVAAGVLFLVLWFCTSAGFMGALAGAGVLSVLGILFLRESPAPAH